MTSSKRRWQRLLPLVLAFGIPAVLFVPAFHWSSEFAVSLHTKAIRFTTAASNKNAGIFNSNVPIELTVSGFERLENDAGKPVKNPDGQASCTFENARLSSIDLSQPLKVGLEVFDNALQMTLVASPNSAPPLATWETSLRQTPSTGPCAAGPMEWRAFGANGQLQLILRPIGQAKLPSETRLALAEGESVTFDSARGEPGIVGLGGELQLTQFERKIPQLEGQSLELRKVENGLIVRIEPGPESLNVILRGHSSDLLREGVNEAATSAEYWTGQKPLMKYLSTVSLIGGTLLAFLNFLKLFKLEK